MENEVKIWRIFVAIAETINTGATPVAKAWRNRRNASPTLPVTAASATLNPVASTRPCRY